MAHKMPLRGTWIQFAVSISLLSPFKTLFREGMISRKKEINETSNLHFTKIPELRFWSTYPL